MSLGRVYSYRQKSGATDFAISFGKSQSGKVTVSSPWKGAGYGNLQAIIDAWQTLPDPVKADILATVEAEAMATRKGHPKKSRLLPARNLRTT